VRYLIDTNCCIYLYSNAYPSLTRRVSATSAGEIGMSTIVFAELALGSANGLAPSPKSLEVLIGQIPVVSFDERAARSYATMPFRRGRYDRLLAAHALSLDMIVITRNVADFGDIPGLAVENWTL
jgi:tRNA(fMet)-specific endonuclease VapC